MKTNDLREVAKKINAQELFDTAMQAMPRSDINVHESDLYLRVTPASTDLIQQYQFKDVVEVFVDAIENDLWYDVPFANAKFWEEKLCIQS